MDKSLASIIDTEDLRLDDDLINEVLMTFYSKSKEKLVIPEDKKQFFSQSRCFPIKYQKDREVIFLGVDSQIDSLLADTAVNDVQQHTGKLVIPRQLSSKDINSLLARYSGYTSHESHKVELANVNTSENETRYFTVLDEAIRGHATDIHLEPVSENQYLCRYRVNGILRTAFTFSEPEGRSLLAKFKMQADLNISSRYTPESGSFSYTTGTDVFDIRLETIGTYFGETMVARILPRVHELQQDLMSLGFEAEQSKFLKAMLQKNAGLVIFIGPTGSGKTTTMHAGLREVVNEKTKIVTVEDPVEIVTPGALQIQVFEKQGINMLSAIRSSMRLDPDVILVGEIRDAESAETVLQAAITGHLVLTTMHVSDASLVPDRFYQFASVEHTSINKYTISEALSGVVSQRLTTKIFRQRAIKTLVPEDVVQRFSEQNVVFDPKEMVSLRNFRYTDRERFSAFEGFDMSPTGRTVLAEVVQVDPQLKRMISAGESGHVLRKYLNEKPGHINLYSHAAGKIRNGELDPFDVLRLM